MGISSNDGIFSIGVTQMAIPVGNTLAVYCNFPITPGMNSLLYRNLTGGTLLNLGSGASGTTLSAASLAAIGNTGCYILTTAEYTVDGPAAFYLAAPGATQVVCFMLGKTQGA